MNTEPKMKTFVIEETEHWNEDVFDDANGDW